jgi:hypothetical protein
MVNDLRKKLLKLKASSCELPNIYWLAMFIELPQNGRALTTTMA